jgi:hypothetical protein
MIPLFVFYLHMIGFTYFFVREYQREGLSAGFLTLGFLILIFSVGWTISSIVWKSLIDEIGFGTWLNRDALSLASLTVCEAVLYSFYFREKKQQTV